jgi:hypothetical protein
MTNFIFLNFNLLSFEMWCWRRIEISWTDSVRNKEVLHMGQGEEEYHTYNKKRKTN